MNYTAERINSTHYANIYAVKEAGQVIGTIEQVLAGRRPGAFAYTLCGKYSKRDIKRIFRELTKTAGK